MANRTSVKIGDPVWVEGRDPLWFRVMEFLNWGVPGIRDQWIEGDNMNAEVIDVYDDVVLVQHFSKEYGVEAMDVERFEFKHPAGFWQVWE